MIVYGLFCLRVVCELSKGVYTFVCELLCNVVWCALSVVVCVCAYV